mmetsp:Transcript_19362/g.28939  ORF Transcript_19362/g.28939 Transcript_19362/m.28939 type:complete len:247 (-) Transcript_19362:1106-1846(-)
MRRACTSQWRPVARCTRQGSTTCLRPMNLAARMQMGATVDPCVRTRTATRCRGSWRICWRSRKLTGRWRTTTSRIHAPSSPRSRSRSARALIMPIKPSNFHVARYHGLLDARTPIMCPRRIRSLGVGLPSLAVRLPSSRRLSSRGCLGLRNPKRSCPTLTTRRPVACTSGSASSETSAPSTPPSPNTHAPSAPGGLAITSMSLSFLAAICSACGCSLRSTGRSASSGRWTLASASASSAAPSSAMA